MSAGLLTLLLIGLGAIAYAAVVLDWMERTRPEKKPDYKKALRQQSQQAERRRPVLSEEGITWEQWVNKAATTLSKLWAIPYHEARRLMVEHADFCGMVFPDPQYEWSYDSAKEIAQDYAQEYGEQYGANS